MTTAGIYPEHSDPSFAARLARLEEYQMFATPPLPKIRDVAAFEKQVATACSGFEKTLYQHLAQHYLSRRSPYRGLLLYHGLGVGKTCSAITIAESFLTDHNAGQPPRVLVISPLTLRKSFEEQLFSTSRFLGKQDLRAQCTGDTYARLVHGQPRDDLFLRRMQQLLRSRYQFLTYDNLVSFVENNPEVHDTVILVDEAHNLRQQDVAGKKAAKALEKLVEKGQRNRLVLLSATPMYNEAEEILWLLGLLLKNDGRSKEVPLPTHLFVADTRADLDAAPAAVLQQLASEYVSYLRGHNPFTFAMRAGPAENGVSVLDEAWTSAIPGGLVPTRAGSKQKMGAVKEERGDSPKNLQWLNITYPNGSHGERGFDKMFERTTKNAFPVVYRPGFQDALMPVPGALDMCAAKFATLCEFVRRAQGIVVIYSQFVWSGVLPMAIALEHMGFRRHSGQSGGVVPMLQGGGTVPDPVRYQDVDTPAYCILSGDAQIMGSTRVDALLHVLNHPQNRNGGKIKVVLMTPVASEGLSFRNVREVHLLDPWYHRNRLEQVIGRSIRTCSHVDLPMSDRNVSVFHHVCTTPSKDSADVHAYKIAARKSFQTSRVEALLRDHAMDCALHFHLNYFPRALFDFSVPMRTSQGRTFTHRFGEEPDLMPKCSATLPPADGRSVRPSTWDGFLPTLQLRLQKYMTTHVPGRLFFPLSELSQATGAPETLVRRALVGTAADGASLPGYQGRLHREQWVLAPREPWERVPQIELALPSKKTSDVVGTAAPPSPSETLDRLLATLAPAQDAATTALLFYMHIDGVSWSTVARAMLLRQKEPRMSELLDNLAPYGIFVHQQEAPRWREEGWTGSWIGFVDVFIPAWRILWMQKNASGDGGWGTRAATEVELRKLKEGRTAWSPPASKAWGMFEPKEVEGVRRLILKVVEPKKNAKGVVCSSHKKQDLEAWAKELGMNAPASKTTKDQMCFRVAVGLLQHDRMMTLPVWRRRT